MTPDIFSSTLSSLRTPKGRKDNKLLKAFINIYLKIIKH